MSSLIQKVPVCTCTVETHIPVVQVQYRYPTRIPPVDVLGYPDLSGSSTALQCTSTSTSSILVRGRTTEYGVLSTDSSCGRHNQLLPDDIYIDVLGTACYKYGTNILYMYGTIIVQVLSTQYS